MICKADMDFFLEECELYGIDNDLIFEVSNLNNAIILLYNRAVTKKYPDAIFEENNSSVPHFTIWVNGEEIGECQANSLASSLTFFDEKWEILND